MLTSRLRTSSPVSRQIQRTLFTSLSRPSPLSTRSALRLHLSSQLLPSRTFAVDYGGSDRTIPDSGKEARNAAESKVQDAKQKVQETASTAGYKMQDAKHKVQETASTVESKVQDAASTAGYKLQDAKQKVQETASTAGYKVQDAASTAGYKMQDAKEKVQESASSFADTAESKLQDAKQKVQETASTAGHKLQDAKQKVQETASSISDTAGAKLQDAKQKVQETASTVSDAAGSTLHNVQQKVQETVSSVAGAAGSTLHNVQQKVQDTFSTVSDAASQAVNKAMHSVGLDSSSSSADASSATNASEKSNASMRGAWTRETEGKPMEDRDETNLGKTPHTFATAKATDGGFGSTTNRFSEQLQESIKNQIIAGQKMASTGGIYAPDPDVSKKGKVEAQKDLDDVRIRPEDFEKGGDTRTNDDMAKNVTYPHQYVRSEPDKVGKQDLNEKKGQGQ